MEERSIQPSAAAPAGNKQTKELYKVGWFVENGAPPPRSEQVRCIRHYAPAIPNSYAYLLGSA